MSERLYVFAMPDTAGRERYQPVIDRLAAVHGGPRFDAHLTVLVGSFADVSALCEAVTREAAARAPLVLAPTEVATGTSFTKCVFQRFSGIEELLPLTEALRLVAEPPNTYTLDPHISLFYGQAGAGRLAAREVEPDPRPVRFDRLRIVRTSGPSRDAETVKRWALVAEAPFAE